MCRVIQEESAISAKTRGELVRLTRERGPAARWAAHEGAHRTPRPLVHSESAGNYAGGFQLPLLAIFEKVTLRIEV